MGAAHQMASLISNSKFSLSLKNCFDLKNPEWGHPFQTSANFTGF